MEPPTPGSLDHADLGSALNEAFTPEMREKMVRLEKENEILRRRLESEGGVCVCVCVCVTVCVYMSRNLGQCLLLVVEKPLPTYYKSLPLSFPQNSPSFSLSLLHSVPPTSTISTIKCVIWTCPVFTFSIYLTFTTIHVQSCTCTTCTYIHVIWWC